MFAFVTGQSISHNYQDFGYLYVNVHASAGVSGTGEDVNGDYTDYWAYGSTSHKYQDPHFDWTYKQSSVRQGTR